MPEVAIADGCVNETQAAEFLNVSVHTLRSWRRQTRGPAFVKLGTRVVYRRSAIDDFLELNTTFTPDSPQPEKNATGTVTRLRRAS